MFSIAHIVIIFVVALVVFGPEKLPDLARTLGKVMGEFRRATGDLRSTFEGHIRDLEREAELRKVREAVPAATAAAAPGAEVIGASEENTIGGGQTLALPISTPDATETADPADLVKDMTPPVGTVQSDRPNAAAFAEPASPQQLEFAPPPLGTTELPNSDSEKATDGRSRPA